MKKILEEVGYAAKIVLAICIVSYISIFLIMGELPWDMVKKQTFYSCYYGFPLSFVNGWFFSNLGRFVPWENRPRLRIILGFFGSIFLTMTVLITLNMILFVWIEGAPFRVLYSEGVKGFYLTALLITIIVSLTLHAIEFYKYLQEEKVKNARLKEEKLTSELNTLRAHVDPHFLFNSFNTLSGLIDEDTDKAQNFLGGLSRIYRYILEKREAQTTAVAEELSFAKKYLELQRNRFENSIELDIQISENLLQKEIPSLSLQLLLENAIKHNAFDEDHPLRIEIFEEKDRMIIQNNKKARRNLAESSGLGLQNIKDRYALLGEKKIEITETANSFTVKLPAL